MHKAPVTVITPTIEGRQHLLEEAWESVKNQDYPALQIPHIVRMDYYRMGPATIRNSMVQEVTTPYIAFLDDDDILYPNHISTLLIHIGKADLVYSWCDMINCDYWNPNSYFDAERLQHQNFIPVTCMMRTETFKRLGGFDPDAKEEDWDLWKRLVNSGGTVICVPEITWAYRKHEGNRSKF